MTFSKFTVTLGLAVTFEIFQNRFRVFKVSSTDTNSVVHQSVIFGLFNYSPPSYIFLALTSAVRGGIIRAMPGRDWDSELSTFGKDTVSRKWTKFLNKDRRK